MTEKTLSCQQSNQTPNNRIALLIHVNDGDDARKRVYQHQYVT